MPKAITVGELKNILENRDPNELVSFDDSDYGESSIFAVYRDAGDNGIVLSSNFAAAHAGQEPTNIDTLWWDGKHYE